MNYEDLNLPKNRFTASMMEEFAGWFVKLPAWMYERYTSAPGDLYVVNPVHALEILYVEEQVTNVGFHLIVTEDFPLIIQHTGGSWADFARVVYGF